MRPVPFVSNHAIERYQQRVEPSADRRTALASVLEILRTARARSRPRRWMRLAAIVPGARYLYSARRPSVCLVLVNGVVVTVYSRRVCNGWRLLAGPERIERRRRPMAVPAWQWSGDTGEAA